MKTKRSFIYGLYWWLLSGVVYGFNTNEIAIICSKQLKIYKNAIDFNNGKKNKSYSNKYFDKSLSSTCLKIWKPPDDGGRRGYYNMNERGDFDPRKRNSHNKGLRSRWLSIKDAVFPEGLQLSSLSSLTLQKSLVYINILMFLYQLISAMLSTTQLNEALINSGYSGRIFTPMQILQRNLMGENSIIVRGPVNLQYVNDPSLSKLPYSFTRPIIASSSGPLTMDFIFSQTLGKLQPHRFFTSGFIHGSILHLYLNMRYLSQLPLWLEYGLGKSLYITTFIISIITGNMAHFVSNNNAISACLGASGGICGMNGLMFILYRKLKRSQQSWTIFRNMALLVLFGFIDSGISNASHIGGFLGGALVGILCSPNFRKSYVAKRKVWFSDDSNERLRRIMGPDLVESSPLMPLKFLWGSFFLILWYNPSFRKIPYFIWKGLTQPGTLSRFEFH